jgi:hypothetical protein
MNVWKYTGLGTELTMTNGDVGALIFNDGEAWATKATLEWKEDGTIYNFITGGLFVNGYRD